MGAGGIFFFFLPNIIEVTRAGVLVYFNQVKNVLRGCNHLHNADTANYERKKARVRTPVAWGFAGGLGGLPLFLPPLPTV